MKKKKRKFLALNLVSQLHSNPQYANLTLYELTAFCFKLVDLNQDVSKLSPKKLNSIVKKIEFIKDDKVTEPPLVYKRPHPNSSKEIDKINYSSYLETLKINKRYLSLLKKEGIQTVGDLASRSIKELEFISGIGPVTAKELHKLGQLYS